MGEAFVATLTVLTNLLFLSWISVLTGSAFISLHWTVSTICIFTVWHYLSYPGNIFPLCTLKRLEYVLTVVTLITIIVLNDVMDAPSLTIEELIQMETCEVLVIGTTRWVYWSREVIGQTETGVTKSCIPLIFNCIQLSDMEWDIVNHIYEIASYLILLMVQMRCGLICLKCLELQSTDLCSNAFLSLPIMLCPVHTAIWFPFCPLLGNVNGLSKDEFIVSF